MSDRSRRWFRTLLAVLAGILLIVAGAIALRVRQVERVRLQLKHQGFLVGRLKSPTTFAEVRIVRHLVYVLRGKSIVVHAMATPPTDADWIRALPLLKQLPSVAVISLHGTALSQRSLETFGEFPALERVALTRCEISDADIAALASSRGLRDLRLEDTAVTGTGLASLAGLETLTNLTLDGSPISEDGLDAISQLKQLRTVSLSNVGLAESDIMRLEEALPGVMISDD